MVSIYAIFDPFNQLSLVSVRQHYIFTSRSSFTHAVDIQRTSSQSNDNDVNLPIDLWLRSSRLPSLLDSAAGNRRTKRQWQMKGDNAEDRHIIVQTTTSSSRSPLALLMSNTDEQMQCIMLQRIGSKTNWILGHCRRPTCFVWFVSMPHTPPVNLLAYWLFYALGNWADWRSSVMCLF